MATGAGGQLERTQRGVEVDAEAGLLTIDALDCLDGTPVLDVKPWLATVDVPPTGGA